MSYLHAEFGGQSLPHLQDENIHGVRIGDMGVVYSDETGKVMIVRDITNGNEQDNFQPRVIPSPEKPSAIIDKDGKKYEVVETLHLLPDGVPITRTIRFIKNGKQNELKSVFKYS